MHQPRFPTLALTALLMLGACSSVPSTDRVTDAATAPLNDLNLVRASIPEVLQSAQRQPYALPVDDSCLALSSQVRALDEVLGADLDTPPTASNPGLIERGGNAAGDAAVGALRRTAEGVVPFRSWVRKLSGAERYAKEVAAAIAAGTVRRAYLKGLSSARGCGAPPDAALDAIVAGPQRSTTNRARDAWRHPAETLRFFGLRADAQVLELAPGGGWYTEILAPWLRDQGKLYAAHYSAQDPHEARRLSRQAFEAKLAASPALYDRVVLGTLPVTGFTDLRFDRPLDAVLTFRNVHNWLEDGHLDDRFKAFFAALRPGGVLGIEEHRAAPGTPLAQQIKTGYLTEALVIEHARAAGFELVGRSELNANPRDPKDHPQGVWALPPTLRGAVAGSADRERLLAIGESDRMTLKFIKPLQLAAR